MTTYTLNGDPLAYDSFMSGETRYPANVLDLWSDAELLAIGVIRIPPPQSTLSELKAARLAQVTARREQAFNAGFTPASGDLAGHTLQCRNETDKINWLTSSIAYSAAVSAGHGAVLGATFRTMANVTVTVTFAEGAQVIIQGMAAWGQTIMGRSWALKDEIEAVADALTLEGIDIEAGWP